MENIAASTRLKQRQVVFKMLREAELLTSDNQILPAMPNASVIRAIVADDPAHLKVFTVATGRPQEWM